MLGCEHVLVDGIKIRNNLDVPNCDGIDPDHCRDVEIRKCNIVCGDDAIVIKATRQDKKWGPSANITVKDCVIETKDSGLKIGTETTEDIHDIHFERCEIKSSCRGLTIQLRDEGNVYGIDFSDIKFVASYQAAPWWGRGEAISFTAIPRTKGGKVGTIHDVRVRNVTGRAENSIRINGTPESRIRNVTLDHVAVTFDRWTKYPGAVFDNRPTTAYPDVEPHNTPGISLRYADGVNLKDCSVIWGKNCPPTFTDALETENVTGLTRSGFHNVPAHPGEKK
jgi:polygalacturonase